MILIYKSTNFSSEIGDVDSGDDNESDQQSTLSNSNNSQPRLRLQPNPMKSNALIASTSGATVANGTPNLPSTSRNLYGSVSASPLTVAKETTPLITQQNLINNLHILNSAIVSGDSGSGNQSPSIAFNIPNYLNIMANNSGNNLVRNTPNIFNGNLDVESHTNGPVSVHNRQKRLRSYGNGRNGMVRHETKL